MDFDPPSSKSLDDELRDYIKEVKNGKTLAGFDHDSETFFRFYKKQNDIFVFGTFTEGINCDYETKEFYLNSDDAILKFLLDHIGTYPEMRIES